MADISKIKLPDGVTYNVKDSSVKKKTIDANYKTAFRTETKGDTASGDYISTIRNDTANIDGAPQYGSGLASGRGDTHMYLYTSYSADAFYVGGGNADKLNWVSQVYTTGYKPSKSDVGLGNVDNTADANKSVNYATTAGNANKVNNLTVQTAVPANAEFTDTKVTQTALTSVSDSGEYYILMSPKNNSSTGTTTATKFKGLYFYNGSLVVGDGEYDDETWIDTTSINTKYLQGTVRVYAPSVLCRDITCGETTHNIILPHRYSADEQVVGYWIDGKPIYEKTVILSSAKSLSPNANTVIMSWSGGAIYPVSFKGYRTSSNYIVWEGISASYQNGNLVGVSSRDTAISLESFTIQYRKA